MAERVDPTVQPDQSPRTHPLRDPVRTEAKRHELLAAHYAPLAPRDHEDPG